MLRLPYLCPGRLVLSDTESECHSLFRPFPCLPTLPGQGIAPRFPVENRRVSLFVSVSFSLFLFFCGDGSRYTGLSPSLSLHLPLPYENKPLAVKRIYRSSVRGSLHGPRAVCKSFMTFLSFLFPTFHPPDAVGRSGRVRHLTS